LDAATVAGETLESPTRAEKPACMGRLFACRSNPVQWHLIITI
jgi:hypothetical protein